MTTIFALHARREHVELSMITISDAIALRDDEIDERFVRASGPGGQNVNKVATAVELRFDIVHSTLPDEVKRRLRALARNRISEEGVLLIDSRVHRSQLDNRAAARERLITLLQKAAVRPRKRRATRPTTSSRERRIDSKKRRGKIKSQRRRRGDE